MPLKSLVVVTSHGSCCLSDYVDSYCHSLGNKTVEDGTLVVPGWNVIQFRTVVPTRVFRSNGDGVCCPSLDPKTAEIYMEHNRFSRRLGPPPLVISFLIGAVPASELCHT